MSFKEKCTLISGANHFKIIRFTAKDSVGNLSGVHFVNEVGT